MRKRWAYVGIFILIILGIWGYSSLGENGEDYDMFKVREQDLTEIVSEIGKVVPVKEIDLTFPLTGTISKILVQEGETVSQGDVIARLDTAKLKADLANAQAAIQEAQARLDKIYTGATPEDIQISQTTVTNAENYLEKVRVTKNSEITKANSSLSTAEVQLNSAEVALSNQIKENEEDLKQAYEDALDTLLDSNTKGDTALKQIDYIQETHFDGQSYDDQKVRTEEALVDEKYDLLQPYIDAAVISDYTTIDAALEKMDEFLQKASEVLEYLRDRMEHSAGVNPTVTQKGYIDTERSNISTATANTTSAIQAISSADLDTEVDLNTAQTNYDEALNALTAAQANLAAVTSTWEGNVSAAEGDLRIAKDQLNFKIAPPRAEDLALYRAQVNQAIAYADLIQQNLYDADLRAPSKGLITHIYAETGELATINIPILSMITVDQYQIESFISELDIANVKLGNKAEVEFDAFGAGRIFQGTIIGINPFETLIDGDIYYKVTIGLDTYDESILSGMTVDIEIKTADKEGVLVVPSRYIGEEGNKKFVKVLYGDPEKDEYQRVEVQTGLKGLDMTEILSGLKEGQKIIPYY